MSRPLNLSLLTTNSELISRFEGHANRYSEREVEKDKIHIDKVVEDLKELFSRYDWYDEEITEEQVRYEYRKGEREGKRFLPMSCNNDDMRKWCVGRDECQYSIYRSLPFVNPMYDKLDSEPEGF